MISSLIVDDDRANREYLVGLIGRYSDLARPREAAHVDEGLAAISSEAPDLLFLDVEMPGGSGFDLLRTMGSWPFEVIFTTGFQRYAIQAIRFSAFDYLLKPVQPDELALALDRFRQHRAGPDRAIIQGQLLANLEEPDTERMKLTLTHGDQVHFIPPMDINYCVADNNYTRLYLADGRRFTSAQTLKDYDDMLRPLGFLRIHRSSLVNRRKVDHLDGQHVVMADGLRLEVSRRRREEVRRILSA